MSGSFPPHILPKPANSLPLLAPKPTDALLGQNANGSSRDGNGSESKNGSASASRMMGIRYMSQVNDSVMRRTSQRKRPKVRSLFKFP